MSVPAERVGFLGRLGSAISGGLGNLGGVFAPDPTADPELYKRQVQQNALLQFGLGTLGSAGQPGATFGSSLAGGAQNAAQALQQAQQTAFQVGEQKRRRDREDRLEKAENDRLKLAKEESDRKSNEQSATVGQRFSKLLETPGYRDRPLETFNLVKGQLSPTLAQYGIDPATITTPEQVTALAQQLSAVGAIGAEAPRPEPQEPLEVVVGTDGTPRYQLRSKSIGQQAYRGKGLAVTLPDGTMISEGGPGVVQPGELTKPTQNKLQESIIGAQDRLDRLNSTLSTYKPEFLQARGLIKGKAGELVEFLGGELDPDTKKYLADYSEFRATAANDFNQTLRELSGAAVTDGEAKRALQAAPSPDDRSPTQFEAKAKATAKTIRRAILRANYALKNGIGTKSIDELSRLIPLEAVDAIYEARANEILAELGGGDDKRAEAIQRANREFGIAR